ncbi:membrane-associated phospholipid phosphatase [Pedobacter sp. CAN_A7]|uniref:phosphatase PAP2 family protein n=1 Tax=Pedobacter sp. CAN_A7 TaxID=2787722 RepID=UPI0018CB32A1
MINNGLKNIAFILLLCIPLIGYTQYSDTIQQDSVERKSYKPYVPGLIAITYGVIALADGPFKNLDHYITERRNERRPNFHTTVDDYLRYVPFLAVYGFDALGVKSKNNFKEKTTMVVLSGAIAYVTTGLLKEVTNKHRPNQTDYRSFPSGHATISFAGAEIINQEYGHLSPWYSIAGYTLASATSVLRIYNNEHWFSDVVAGAGVGVLSTKVAYHMYPVLTRMIWGQNNKTQYTLLPTYQQKNIGFSLVGQF